MILNLLTSFLVYFVIPIGYFVTIFLMAAFPFPVFFFLYALFVFHLMLAICRYELLKQAGEKDEPIILVV